MRAQPKRLMTRKLFYLLLLFPFSIIGCFSGLQKSSDLRSDTPKPIRTDLHQSARPENHHIFVSFLLDHSGQIVNPLVQQGTDTVANQKALQALNTILIEPTNLGLNAPSTELTIPISFRGSTNQPDLSDYLDRIPILQGNIESLIKGIQYPEEAKRASLEGRVTVAFIIDKKGFVRFPTVTRSLGAGCDEEALRAVRLARFTPGQINGTPVNVITSLTFLFTLT